ncbi:MAG: carboxymuconolactone decarboxylase family protein [Allosphingosinicella sp.]
MHTNWPEMAQELNDLLAALRKAQPEPMRSFAEMGKAALKAEALDTMTKELIALAISVAIRCEPCITYHARAAVRAGASDAQLAETMGMAIYMGAGPSVMYAAKALEAVGQWREATAG